jgi:hypothetical protein
VQEERRRAGARERGRELAADDARLAHAGDDDSSAALAQHAHRALEPLVEPIDEGENGRRFGLQHAARQREIRLGILHDVVDLAACGRVDPRQLAEERLEPIETQRVGAVAQRLAGSSCTSMNTASTPAATPAAASGSMYSGSPPTRPRRRRAAAGCGSRRRSRGSRAARSIGNARMSTTRLL